VDIEIVDLAGIGDVVVTEILVARLLADAVLQHQKYMQLKEPFCVEVVGSRTVAELLDAAGLFVAGDDELEGQVISCGVVILRALMREMQTGHIVVQM
jgi:hypothetical protein